MSGILVTNDGYDLHYEHNAKLFTASAQEAKKLQLSDRCLEDDLNLLVKGISQHREILPDKDKEMFDGKIPFNDLKVNINNFSEILLKLLQNSIFYNKIKFPIEC